MSLLSRDGHIVDCTARHPGVERPFFSVAKLFNFTPNYVTVGVLKFTKNVTRPSKSPVFWGVSDSHMSEGPEGAFIESQQSALVLPSQSNFV